MTTPAAPEPAAGGLDQRVTALESGQQTILGKLDKLLGFHAPNDPGPAPEAERPEVNIADEIRRQLVERDAKKPPEPAAAPKPADVKEQAPEPVTRRIERIMGWAQ